jgi:hypothetical protein
MGGYASQSQEARGKGTELFVGRYHRAHLGPGCLGRSVSIKKGRGVERGQPEIHGHLTHVQMDHTHVRTRRLEF